MQERQKIFYKIRSKTYDPLYLQTLPTVPLEAWYQAKEKSPLVGDFLMCHF